MRLPVDDAPRAPDAEPEPPGAVHVDRDGGLWQQTVPRAEIDRLFTVTTWAIYRGEAPVRAV